MCVERTHIFCFHFFLAFLEPTLFPLRKIIRIYLIILAISLKYATIIIMCNVGIAYERSMEIEKSLLIARFFGLRAVNKQSNTKSETSGCGEKDKM